MLIPKKDVISGINEFLVITLLNKTILYIIHLFNLYLLKVVPLKTQLPFFPNSTTVPFNEKKIDNNSKNKMTAFKSRLNFKCTKF